MLPLNREGEGLAAKFHRDKVQRANGWGEVLLPEIGRQQGTGKTVAFPHDAAFAILEMYQALEERGVQYAFAFLRTKVWSGTLPN